MYTLYMSLLICYMYMYMHGVHVHVAMQEYLHTFLLVHVLCILSFQPHLVGDHSDIITYTMYMYCAYISQLMSTKDL